MLAVQYLERGPDVAEVSAKAACARLRAALQSLPISRVIMGWSLPERLSRACVEESALAGAELYRWHPLLAGSPGFEPRLEWQAVGLSGEPVPGFQGVPEFSFLCPNRPAAWEAALDQLGGVIRQGFFQGVFLDRIRYPSPAPDPARFLTCFCADCRRAAAAEGLDLQAVGARIRALCGEQGGRRSFARLLLDPSARDPADADMALIGRFLDFRARSVTRIVQTASYMARSAGLRVGLDCFSPALTRMVGQDLASLNAHCDWIKVMTYGHVLAPAGLPFELLGLARWIMGRGASSEAEALGLLADVAGLPLPTTIGALEETGLSPAALAGEVRRGRDMGVSEILAGIELVEMAGVTNLETGQVEADLRAFRDAQPDGLVLSWDLWRMPARFLEIVRKVWR